MQISRIAVRGFHAATLAGSLCLGIGGCGGDGEESPEVVAAADLCGGQAISDKAARALKEITGSSRFEVLNDEDTVEHAAEELIEMWPKPPMGREPLCYVQTPPGAAPVYVKTRWGMGSGPPTGAQNPKHTALDMGELTLMGEGEAYVFFACRTDRLGDGKKVAYVSVSVEFSLGPKEVADVKGTLREPYVIVAHSLSLALVKELRCQKNGGLPARPVLEPISQEGQRGDASETG